MYTQVRMPGLDDDLTDAVPGRDERCAVSVAFAPGAAGAPRRIASQPIPTPASSVTAAASAVMRMAPPTALRTSATARRVDALQAVREAQLEAHRGVRLRAVQQEAVGEC